MCLGPCHAAMGARKKRMAGRVCKPVRWSRVSIRERSDKELRLEEQRCMRGDGGTTWQDLVMGMWK